MPSGSFREAGGEARFPVPNSLMCEHEAAVEEHLSDIAKAEFVANPPSNDKKDDVGGKLEEVGRSPRPLIEPPEAAATAQTPVP